MIERRGEVRFGPRGGCVAGIASLFELALVWVAMAVRAIGEWQTCIAYLAIGARSVAALA